MPPFVKQEVPGAGEEELPPRRVGAAESPNAHVAIPFHPAVNSLGKAEASTSDDKGVEEQCSATGAGRRKAPVLRNAGGYILQNQQYIPHNKNKRDPCIVLSSQ
jgi:hypothetical protein